MPCSLALLFSKKWLGSSPSGWQFSFKLLQMSKQTKVSGFDQAMQSLWGRFCSVPLRSLAPTVIMEDHFPWKCGEYMHECVVQLLALYLFKMPSVSNLLNRLGRGGFGGFKPPYSSIDARAQTGGRSRIKSGDMASKRQPSASPRHYTATSTSWGARSPRWSSWIGCMWINNACPDSFVLVQLVRVAIPVQDCWLVLDITHCHGNNAGMRKRNNISHIFRSSWLPWVAVHRDSARAVRNGQVIGSVVG
jgi:hypothetical protein